MTTHFGAGARQAIEASGIILLAAPMIALDERFSQDAHILGRLLSDPAISKSNLDAALEVYQSIRLPFANSIVERSRETGFIYEFNSPGLEWEDDDGNEDDNMQCRGSDKQAEKITKAVYDRWAWQWQQTPDVDWVKAETMLHEMLQSANTPRSAL